MNTPKKAYQPRNTMSERAFDRAPSEKLSSAAIALRAESVALQVDEYGRRKAHDLIDWSGVNLCVLIAGEYSREAIRRSAE